MNVPAPAAQTQAPPRQPLQHYQQRGDRLLEEQKYGDAEALLTQGLAAHPNHPSLEWRMADVEFRTGRGPQARDRLTRIARSRPAEIEGTFFVVGGRLGRALRDRGFAESMVREGLRRFPLNPDLRFLAGQLLSDVNEHTRAIEHLNVAVNLSPNHMIAINALGYALEQSGDLERAEKVLRGGEARAAGDTVFNILLNLGNVLQKQERYEEGRVYYERAMKLRQPGYLFANFGALLRKSRRFDQGRTIYRRGLVIDPANGGAYYNLGNLEKEVGRLDDAVAAYRLSVCIQPDRASTHWNLSLALLSAGYLEEGFAEYEWRWLYDGFPSRRRNFPQPMWDGAPLDGRTLLVHAEQGMGDHLQFARFIPEIAKQNGRVIVECHEPLMRLFEHYADKVEIVERLKEPSDFDLHLPLLSAPLVLGVKTLEDLPPAPFLAPPADWTFDIPEARPDAFKIGIIWGGNPQFPGDRDRSAKLDYFLPFLEKAGVQLFSLQKGDREPELKDAPPEIVRLSDRITDFCDTASIMTQLDLVITTCTSTAHLAGALGVPMWVVLHHNPDWRWLRHRTDSPWYGSARLFQQETPGDWDGVIAAVGRALDETLAGR